MPLKVHTQNIGWTFALTVITLVRHKEELWNKSQYVSWYISVHGYLFPDISVRYSRVVALQTLVA